MDFTTQKTSKNLTLGDNFSTIFGATTVSVSVPLLHSAPTTKNHTVTEVVASVTPCTLSDVYNALPLITTNGLFVVHDTHAIPQIVFVFKDALGQHVVSPTSPQVPEWYTGTVLYSKNNITNV